MEHLSLETIIDFVSMQTLNDDTLRLASEVNAHIQHCEECFALVESVQRIWDAFEENCHGSDFRTYLQKESAPELQARLQQELK